MSSEERELELQNAILEWQKKYGIRDGDPLLASLELFKIFFRISGRGSGAGPTTFEEFRETIEVIDERTRSFAKLAGELLPELRKLPEAAKQMGSARVAVLFLLTITALVAGMIIGKFAQ